MTSLTPSALSSSHALVVFSGGQDSTTCLGWAIKHFKSVEAITFDYGQRHRIEIEQSRLIAQKLGIKQFILEFDLFSKLGDSALLETSSDLKASPHRTKPHLPASFVPNRNALFFTLAHAYAQKEGLTHIITGISEADYSGYPDCREEFITHLERTLNLGSDSSILFAYPLLHRNKAQTFALAKECGVLDLVLEESHTCYNGDRSHRYEWGYGCKECPACGLREKGWREYQASL